MSFRNRIMRRYAENLKQSLHLPDVAEVLNKLDSKQRLKSLHHQGIQYQGKLFIFLERKIRNKIFLNFEVQSKKSRKRDRIKFYCNQLMGDLEAHRTQIKQCILNIFKTVTRVCVTIEWQEVYITLAIRAHQIKLILRAQRLKAFLVFNTAD